MDSEDSIQSTGGDGGRQGNSDSETGHSERVSSAEQGGGEASDMGNKHSAETPAAKEELAPPLQVEISDAIAEQQILDYIAAGDVAGIDNVLKAKVRLVCPYLFLICLPLSQLEMGTQSPHQAQVHGSACCRTGQDWSLGLACGSRY